MADKLKGSDPLYPEVDRLQNMLVMLVNREIANKHGNKAESFVAGQLMGEIPDTELQAIKTSVIGALGHALEKVLNRFLEETWGEFLETLTGGGE